VAECHDKLTKALDKFRFNEAADAIYHFTWSMFCDAYIELTKKVYWGDDEEAKTEIRATTAWVLDQIYIMLHPFMPFITEELWNATGDRDTDLILASWPEMDQSLLDGDRAQETATLLAVIREINSWRPDAGVLAGHKIATIINTSNQDTLKSLSAFSSTLEFLAKADPISFNGDLSTTTAPQMVLSDNGIEIGCVFEGVELTDEDIARTKAKIEKLGKEIGAISGRLGNENYLAKAPEEVVEKAKAALSVLREEVSKLEEVLA
jgi:valyl-tRNA synthetase